MTLKDLDLIQQSTITTKEVTETKKEKIDIIVKCNKIYGPLSISLYLLCI